MADNIIGRSSPALHVPDTWQGPARSFAIRVQEVIDQLFFGNYKIRAGSKLAKSVTDYAYPVGSIYICDSDTNPGTKLGGTWVSVTSSIGYAWKRTE